MLTSRVFKKIWSYSWPSVMLLVNFIIFSIIYFLITSDIIPYKGGTGGLFIIFWGVSPLFFTIKQLLLLYKKNKQKDESNLIEKILLYFWPLLLIPIYMVGIKGVELFPNMDGDIHYALVLISSVILPPIIYIIQIIVIIKNIYLLYKNNIFYFLFFIFYFLFFIFYFLFFIFYFLFFILEKFNYDAGAWYLIILFPIRVNLFFAYFLIVLFIVIVWKLKKNLYRYGFSSLFAISYIYYNTTLTGEKLIDQLFIFFIPFTFAILQLIVEGYYFYKREKSKQIAKNE